ncbi:MAG: hypothetical protein RIB98_14840 [Acidimicrobiales bacterium]
MEGESTTTALPATTTPAEPTGDAFAFTFRLSEESSPESAARYIDAQLSQYPGASPAEINGRDVTVVVTGINESDTDAVLDAVTSGDLPTVSFRPVLDVGASGTDLTAAAALCDYPEGQGAPAEFAAGIPTPDADADQCMVAEQIDNIDGVDVASVLLLGPAPALISTSGVGARLTGLAVEDANAQLTAGWSVDLVLRSGSPGIDDFNALAAQCVAGSAVCPSGRVAIEINGGVVSAPTIQAASFDRTQIQITGNFSEGEAKDLALVLRDSSSLELLMIEGTRTTPLN